MGLFYDSTYLLVILAALISMAVSARMNTIFGKYQTVRSYSGMTPTRISGIALGAGGRTAVVRADRSAEYPAGHVQPTRAADGCPDRAGPGPEAVW